MSPKTVRRDKGEGSLFQRASDGMWLAVVDLGYDGTGKRRRKTVSSKDYATAVRKLRALRRQLEDGQISTTSSPTVSKWLAVWLEDIAAKKVRPRTLDTYRGYVRNYIEPALGKRRLDQVRPEHVRAMHKAITDGGRSSTTARQAHAILARAFKDARRDGHPCIDIADRMDPPATAVAGRTALTVDEAVRLLRSSASDPLGPRWATALLLGARQGECLGLEWDRIDFEAGRVDLSWQLQRLPYRHGCALVDGKPACGRRRRGNCPQRVLEVPPGFEYREAPGGLYLTRPKSRAGKRRLPLVPELAAMLDRLPRTSTLVFPRPDGSAVEPSDDNAAWHRALEAAELPEVPLHAARHTTATLLRAAGVDMRTITAIMGHASGAVTEAYLHEDDTHQRAALEGLGRTLAGGQEALTGRSSDDGA